MDYQEDLERVQCEYLSKLAAALPDLVPEEKRGQFHAFFGGRIMFSSKSEKEVDDYIGKTRLALAKVFPLIRSRDDDAQRKTSRREADSDSVSVFQSRPVDKLFGIRRDKLDLKPSNDTSHKY